MAGMNRLIILAALLAVALPVAAAAEESDYLSDYVQVLDEISAATDSDSSYSPVEEAVAQFYRENHPQWLEGRHTERRFDVVDLDKEPAERIRYNGRIYGKYSDDDISQNTKWEKEFEVSLRYGAWDSYLRWSDVNPFHNESDPFRWEKARLRWRGENTKITAGSFNQLFGRGLALNLYEDRILNFDNEPEGVKAEVDLGGAELVALWGTHKLRSELTNSEVSAVRLAGEVTKGLELGGHVVHVEYPDYTYSAEEQNMLDYDIYGGDAKIRSGPFDAYIETVRLQRDQVEFGSEWDTNGDDGHGYYATAHYSGPGYVFGAEYKDYNGLQQPFAVVPPVRRYNETASADANDQKGYLVSLDWNPFRDDSHFALHYGQDNMHAKGLPYTEGALIYSSPPTRRTSWIGEYWHVNDLGELIDLQRLTLNHQVTPDWTASTFTERQRFKPGYIDSYTDYIVEAEVAYQTLVNLAYTYETTGQTDPLKSRWGIWEFTVRPDDLQEIGLAIGSRREGVTCSGGICRQEPAFDGVRVDYLRRF
jgi:hypothetical protein